MKKQVIQNFLNLPGIVGLALMDGYSRPYFCGIDQYLNFQQKEALTQGIQQVISTTPDSFEAFEFRFSQRDARIYRLESGVILLVVTDDVLDLTAYQVAITQLKRTLKTDPQSTVSTFRLLAGSTSLSKQQYWSNRQPAPNDQTAEQLSKDHVSKDHEAVARAPELSIDPSTEAVCQWDQSVAALNQLTDATAQYLGKIVVANAWRSTRPDGEALERLQLDRGGHFSYSLINGEGSNTPINSGDYEVLCNWVQKFIQRCSQVIRDYPEIVLNQALDEQQRATLRIEILSD